MVGMVGKYERGLGGVLFWGGAATKFRETELAS